MHLLKGTNHIYIIAAMIVTIQRNVFVTEALRVMEVEYEWDQFTFVYENSEQEEQLKASGILEQGNSVPFDIDVETLGRRRTFLAFPHVMPGSAVTLSTVENTTQRFNPPLSPYPSWKWHANNSGCDGLTSVYRMNADACGRLWVVDSGDDLSLGASRNLCPPQLLVFNLTTDELIARQRFPRNQSDRMTLMINVVTDPRGKPCDDDVYAYIAEANAYKIIVYHLGTQRFWRVPGDLFFPQVSARNFIIHGVAFSKSVGVLGLALSPCLDENCDRFLYFHSFTGFIEGRVRTSILRNESLFFNGNDGARNDIHLLGTRPRQSVAQAMSKEGYLFFGLLGTNTLNCWNFRTLYNEENFHVVEHDNTKISFQMGVKVKTYENGEQHVWMVSNNAQLLFSGNYSSNTTYPVHALRGKVKDLVRGSACVMAGDA